MKEKIVHTGEISLWTQAFGNPSDPAVLLIMGNSAQGIMWTDDFCQQLTAEHRYVIRYDQRDTGLSTCIDYATQPYSLFDLAKDALDILDDYDIPAAHIVGLSMGGAIAQLLATYHHERVLTITTMMSSPDLSIKNDAFKGKDVSQAKLPPPRPEFVTAVINLNCKAPETREEKLIQLVENWRLANGSEAPFDEVFWHELLKKTLDREELNSGANDVKFANHSNHSKAQSATTEPNLETLKRINVPTLVIQGKEDPIFPPAHAEAIADQVPDATLLLINQMGHALNPVFTNEIVSAISLHTNSFSNQLRLG
jgi:pimeloyl-ACP methyl ester carboxylesterase